MLLLDSDIVIDLLRGYPPALQWLRDLGDAKIALSGFVVMELIQGCPNKREQGKLQKAIRGFDVRWPNEAACNEALNVFSLYHLSHSIGVLDALIAQTAVALNAPLCTFNQKHYAVVPNLKTVQPYKKS